MSTLKTIFNQLHILDDMYLNLNKNKFGYLSEIFEKEMSAEDTFEEFLKNLLDYFDDLCDAKILVYSKEDKNKLSIALGDEYSDEYKAIFNALNTPENKQKFENWINS